MLEVFKVIYEAAAQQKGAAAWCCKSMEVGYHLDVVHTYFPKAKYIYLYRDGRDVAVSTRRAPLGEKHFYFIAKRWVEEQQNVLSFKKKNPQVPIFKLRYEDLVHHPEKAGREVCTFLGQEYSKKMLYYYKSNEAIATASSGSLWGNVVKQVMKGNTEKFKTEAPKEMVEIFENIAGEMLDVLGYSRWLVKRGREAGYSPGEVARFREESRQTTA